jgi:hypothetical protein
MATNAEHPPSIATELIFVYAYHNLPDISEAEWIDYYASPEFNGLRDDLKTHIEWQLDLFSDEDYFSAAEYDVDDAISDAEKAVFRSGLGPEDRETPFEELHPTDLLAGFRAVMLERVASGDLSDIRRAVGLFNHTMEYAIDGLLNRNPRSYIRIETAAQFGPWFIDRLFKSIESLKQSWRHDLYTKFIGGKFEALEPVLSMMRPLVLDEGWPHSDLALGRLLLIVDCFKKVVEEEWQF